MKKTIGKKTHPQAKEEVGGKKECPHELYEWAFADPDGYKFECVLCGKSFKESNQSSRQKAGVK